MITTSSRRTCFSLISSTIALVSHPLATMPTFLSERIRYRARLLLQNAFQISRPVSPGSVMKQGVARRGREPSSKPITRSTLPSASSLAVSSLILAVQSVISTYVYLFSIRLAGPRASTFSVTVSITEANLSPSDAETQVNCSLPSSMPMCSRSPFSRANFLLAL